MKIFVVLLWIMTLVLLLMGMFYAFVFNNNKRYCYLYEHKNWKLWESFIKNYDKFKFVEEYDDSYLFKWYDELGNERYNLVIWKENKDDAFNNWNKNSATIHCNTNCVLCSFDQYHSKKMAKLVWKNEFGTELAV